MVKTLHGKLEYNYITDGIYIGTNQCCQMDFDRELLSQDITADISLEADRLDAPFGVEFYAWLPVKDHTAPSRDQFILGVGILEDLVASGKKVYVHCKNGHGRAPTLVAAYLIRKGKTLEEAEALLKSQRQSVHLNDVQRRVLKEFAASPK